MANRAETTEEVQRAISPSVRRSLIRNELKRQILECVLREHFNGFIDAPLGEDGNKVKRPLQEFARALGHGVFVRDSSASSARSSLRGVAQALPTKT